VSLVEVAVPAPLLKTLTYRVPDRLIGMAVPGARVRVELGSRRVIGMVWSETREVPEGAVLKELLAVIDPPGQPAVTPDVLATMQWMADYYVAPPGDTMRAALPAALAPEHVDRDEPRGAPARTRVVTISSLGTKGDLDEFKRAPAQRRVIEQARDGVARAPAELARLAETSVGVVGKLVQAGWLDLTEAAVASAAPEQVEFPVQRPAQLSSAQRTALESIAIAIERNAYAAFVLFGVTGSGKTEVYLRAAELCLMRQGSALFLVPEIGLTPGLAHALSARFGPDVAVLHSGLSDTQRYQAWEQVRQGRTRLVVGARSALFAPLVRLGLIVVDEEHDAGYKQEESPRYHARDLALVRAREVGAVVILGSATPALESWTLSSAGKAARLELPERVSGGALATIELVDMRTEFRETGQDQTLSRGLITAIATTLERGEQAMVLLNRRGYTRTLRCRACGLAESCSACSVSLTWHLVGERLRCHYCGAHRPRPTHCTQCGSPHLIDLGSGTQRVESVLRQRFPQARLARLDRDTARRRTELASTLQRFARGEIDVLIGTQMIAKGHHFPAVTLVGVVAADAALAMPDFRATERTFQLLTQVAGRAGRGERPGRTLFQVSLPDHPVVQAALTQDYVPFATRELAARALLRFPPDSALGLILVRDENQTRAFERAGQLAESLRRAGEGHLAVLGPMAAPLSKLRGQWRVQLLLRARKRRRLVTAVRHAVLEQIGAESALPSWLTIDIDPQAML
jgi:primosomal protein N' (replication factor Y)